MKFILKLSILFAIYINSFAQDSLSYRAQAYNSYQVSNELLSNINSEQFLSVRGELLGRSGIGSGVLIDDDLIAQTKEYMNFHNNRASFSIIDDVEGLRAIEEAKVRLQNIPDALQENIKAVKSSFNNSMMRSLNELGRNPTQETIAKHKEFSEFMKANNLGALHSDILDHIDSGQSSPTKKVREMISEIISKKETLIKSGIPELEELAKSISRVNDNANLRAQDLNDEKNLLEKKIQNYDPIKSAQVDINTEFFASKNLNKVTNINGLTQVEMRDLLSMKDGPLKTNDYDKAMNIVNEKRASRRVFIENVSNISNEFTSASVEGRTPNLDGKLSSVHGEGSTPSKNLNTSITSSISSVDHHSNLTKYNSFVSSRVSVEGHNGGIDARHVSSIDSRLALMDSITGGAVNLSGTKDIDVAKSLMAIPKEDRQARKAFAKYILEKGSDSQRRSLKINDFSLSSTVEKEIDFKLKCRKVPSRW